MKLGARSTLPDVAIAVGDALRRNGITGVLTGGACASLYTGGRVHSVDADFVLSGRVTQLQLDDAMASVGFRRRGDRYVHPAVRFFIEFPRGPLAIGRDHSIHPVRRRKRKAETLALSPTDACRDRLAAFYHWNDRQSLVVAVRIALVQRVRMETIRRWSEDEGMSARFEVFREQLSASRSRRRPAGASRRPRT